MREIEIQTKSVRRYSISTMNSMFRHKAIAVNRCEVKVTFSIVNSVMLLETKDVLADTHAL